MQTIFKILWDMHPFEHFADFCSSLIVVITCASLIYKPTRDRIMKSFTNKKAVNSLANDKKELNERLDKLELATVTLLHDRLYTACEWALRNGKISIYNLDNIKHLYDEYHRLGGNGTGTELYRRVKNLPIVSENWEEK
ncbi:MAG: hypothetical protein ACOX6E_09210 [Syntrophomonadaceae bacterium]|jgi:hypothetical protein